MAAKQLASVVLKKGLPIVAGLVLLGGIVVWMLGIFGERIEPGRHEVQMPLLAGEPTDVVHEVTQEYIEEVVGTLKAATRTVVSAKVLATIEEITVAAGDEVSAGQTLVRLASDELTARLRQAEGTLDSAIASRTEADAAFQRATQLRERNVITQAEFDQRTAQANRARAEVERAEQAVNEAQVLLSFATIHAPTSGRVVDRLAEPGDTAIPGEPLLIVYDATSLRLEAPVSERLAVALKVGQTLGVHIDALDRDVEATVDEIVPQAEAPSRSFLVKAALPRADDLYEGMFGRLRIPGGTRRHLCLPTGALERVGQLEFVRVVRSDGSLERRLIKTGRLGRPDRIEVLSGLEEGDRVVLREPSAAESEETAHE